jgi:hypothetical protein
MSDDPSFSTTKTLLESLRNDVGQAQIRLREADRFLSQAMATVWELKRRQDTGNDAI